MTSVHLGYIISCLAQHKDERAVSHVPMFANCESRDEATGYGLRMAREIFPAEAGYINPHVVVRSMSIDDWRIRELYAQLDAAA